MLNSDTKKIKAIEQGVVIDQAMLTAKNKTVRTWYSLRRQFLPFYFLAPPKWRLKLRAASKQERMQANFSLLGAVRSGTTSLSEYIIQHPCVALPLTKEVKIGGLFSKRLVEAQLPTVSQQRKIEDKYGKAITGYCTPSMPHMLLPYLLKSLNKNMKVFVMLRDPVDRAFAHWRWDQEISHRFFQDPLFEHVPDFSTLIELEIQGMLNHANTQTVQVSGVGGGYLQHSNYLPFVAKLIETFGRENIMFINSSDFFEDPLKVVNDIYQALELPEYIPQAVPVKNAGRKANLDPEVEEKLRNFFQPINEKLFDLIGEEYDW